MLRLALIGCGAIGSGVAELLTESPDARIVQVVVPTDEESRVRPLLSRYAPWAQLLTEISFGPVAPDLVVECAGHSAVSEHVIPALEKGIPAIVVSIGAMSEPHLAKRLEAAAKHGGARVHLIAGAIGGIDALSAAQVGGLETVVYTGRKPPLGWKDTAAEQVCNLASLTKPVVIFSGTARDAASLYPKNANVAATVALATLGLDATTVTLIADPGVQHNVHHVKARGVFGEMELSFAGNPLSGNPKTSALTIFSVVRAIHNLSRWVAL